MGYIQSSYFNPPVSLLDLIQIRFRLDSNFIAMAHSYQATECS